MPVYEYRCDSCGHSFDLIQPMDAEKTADCEKCGSPARRVREVTAQEMEWIEYSWKAYQDLARRHRR